MIPFSKVSGRPVLLPIDNVDTDQIIPASFLKVLANTVTEMKKIKHAFAEGIKAEQGIEF